MAQAIYAGDMACANRSATEIVRREQYIEIATAPIKSVE